jgi:hypothetical protein
MNSRGDRGTTVVVIHVMSSSGIFSFNQVIQRRAPRHRILEYERNLNLDGSFSYYNFGLIVGLIVSLTASGSSTD